jgi:hypothetical protein
METSENWLRTDEVEEFIGALEFSAELLGSVSNDPMRWKWAIISLHNAFQGACVCALRGADTMGISVLDKESGAAMWHWLEVESRKQGHGPPPKEKLAKTLELYNRVQRPDYLANPLKVDRDRDRRIRKLNSLRNEFIHFVPKGFSVELGGMPAIVESVRSSIEHLAVRFPTFDHHFKLGDEQRIAQALSKLQVV